jgi:putative oxidoreductase
MSNKLASVLFTRLLGIDCALLLLRVLTSLLLFYKHGAEKLFAYQHMYAVFTHPHPLGNFDPIGIGKSYSLWVALFSDGICSVFVMLGLFTRISTIVILMNIMVSFFLVFHGVNNDHGELILLYTIIMSVIFLAGPGKISLDNHLFQKFQ